MPESQTPRPIPPEDQHIREAIGTRLKERRKALGWSLNEAVERLGINVTRSALTFYEQGRRPIPASTLVRIAKAYGCRGRDLLPDDVDEATAFQDITVRVRTRPGVDLDAVEAALVGAAHEHAAGGLIVSASMAWRPDSEPEDLGEPESQFHGVR